MSGSKIFVDTNILIYLLQGDHELTQILNGKELVISIITELELLSFPGLKSNEIKVIKKLISDCQVININNEIKELAIIGNFKGYHIQALTFHFFKTESREFFIPA